MTAATQNRMIWDSRYGQDSAADIVRKPRRTDESHAEIEAWGIVKCPAGKSYRVACYRTFDRNAERGNRVTWDCAVYIGAGKGSRIAPESMLAHVRLFALRMFKRAVEACAAADWDCGDARWPACDPQAAAVAAYAEAVETLATVAEMEGAEIAGETLAFNQRNLAEHAACLADSTGLFDIEATESAIAWANIHAGEGRARADGFRKGKASRDFDNPHMEGTGHAIAWQAGYDAGLAVFRNETVSDEPAATERQPLRLSGFVRQDSDNGPSLVAAGTLQTIDMTPTWAEILPALLAAIENGTEEGRRIAREELARMASLADSYGEAQKAIAALRPGRPS